PQAACFRVGHGCSRAGPGPIFSPWILGVLERPIKTTNCVLRQFSKKIRQSPCFCAPHVHIVCGAVSLLPPMPFLGVSSLDLGRLRQRRRPLYLVYFTLPLFTGV